MKTSIDYTDETWQVVTGCSLVSAGCENCFAARNAATRLKYLPAYEGLARQTERGRYQWTGEVRLHRWELSEPLHWRKPRVVFVAPSGDLFHGAVPDHYIDDVFATMALCRGLGHTFLLLTKRPDRMHSYLTESNIALDVFFDGMEGIPWPLPNVYLGTSVENQTEADRRLPELVKLAAQGWHTWVSMEPQIERVEVGTWFWSAMSKEHKCAIDWLVQGCESGPHARPFELAWARSVRDQCQVAGVPYYLKQLPSVDGKRVIHAPELDGRQWLETPW